MQEPGENIKRINLPYFEGVNSLVSFNIAKKTELVHAENARSKTVGTIEKREGQVVLGTDSNGNTFRTTANYGLFPFQNANNQGFYRISITPTFPTLSINIFDKINVSSAGSVDDIDFSSEDEVQLLSIDVKDSMTVSDIFNTNTGTKATIYYLNNSSQWIPLASAGADIPGGLFDYTYAEGNVFLSNFNGLNRYIGDNGTTVTTSATATGHLYNTPPASKINFYKDRLYLADFKRDFNRYKTTVLRSSYPMGIISLINGDQATISSGATIEITDTKYFYAASGANLYDIYRGETLIKQITVTSINETSVVATWTGGAMSLLSSDEVWISGTYDGEKVFRWVNNPTISGRDVKQYDTFKLAGGENDPITMLTNIGNVMLISNKSTLASWNDYTLENYDLDIGCVSKKGYVKMIGTLYFLHYTGIYSTSGGVPTLISNKIEPYITGATKTGKENSAAGKKGRSIFFTLGDVTLYKPDGSINKVLNDVCVEYNLVQENWYVHTNVKASEFATFIEEANSDRLEFTDTEGDHAVKEFLSGETDDGKEISFRIDLAKITMQPTHFEYLSNPIALVSEVERGSAMQVFVNIENKEEYYPVQGKITKGLSIVKITDKDSQRGKPPACRLISISIRDSSLQLCKISRLSLLFTPTSNTTSDNET